MNGYNLKITAPENAAYFTFDCNQTAKTNIMIFKDSKINNIDYLPFNTQNTFIHQKEKIKSYNTDFITKCNLIDSNNFTDNRRPTETVGTSTMYDWIQVQSASSHNPVNISDCEYLSYFTNCYIKIYFYDENYLLLEIKEIQASTKSGVIELPNNCCYFIAHVTTSNKNNFTIIKGNEVPTRLIESNEYYVNLKEVNDLKNNINSSILKEKTILWSGDSIAYGQGNNGISYANIIANNNQMNSTNYAISGTCVAKQEESSNSILERILNMSETADYVIFEGGWNDIFNTNLGAISNGFDDILDEYTWCGALESLIKQSYQKWTNAKIGFILAHGKTDSYRETQNQFWDKAIEIFDKWHLPYIDLRHNGLCMFNSTLANLYTADGDGTHPNELGYEKYYVNQITKWLESI